jgi:hypothetical protein
MVFYKISYLSGMIHNIIKDRPTKLFIMLAGFFIANALVSEMIGVKIFSLEDTLGIPKANFSLFGVKDLSFSLTVGVIPWPVIFVLTDIVNEYYGVKGVRFLSFLTVALISFAFLVFYFALHAKPDTAFWIGSYANLGVPDMQLAFNAIFGQGMNIIIGSLSAFVLGQIIDAMVFRKIKKFTGEKYIWARSTVSTLVSQFIDSVVVTYIAFTVFRGVPLGRSMAWAFTSYGYKFLIALLFTPVVYLIHWGCEKYLGKDTAREMKEQAIS